MNNQPKDLTTYIKKTTYLEDGLDVRFFDAAKIVIEYNKASASLIQRRLSLGYAQSARIIDQLEAVGVISPSDGAKPREVLISSLDELKEIERAHRIEQEETVENENLDYTLPERSVLTPEMNNPWRYSFSQIIKDDATFNRYPLSIPLGVDEHGKVIQIPLTQPSNVMIVGNTISQKEGVLDTALLWCLFKNTPEQVRFILIDPSSYFSLYNPTPHLLTPVISEPEKSISAMRWLRAEIMRRQKLFKECGIRSYENIDNMFRISRIITVIHFYEDLVRFSHFETSMLTEFITKHGNRVGVHLIIAANSAKSSVVSMDIQSEIHHKLFLRTTYRQEVGPNKVKGTSDLVSGKGILFSNSNNQSTSLELIHTSEENVDYVITTLR